MSKGTYLFGGSGFLGPAILKKYPDIVSVGRTAPPAYVKNRHIKLDSLIELELLDDEPIENVIFLIGSSDHHFLNSEILAGIHANVLPLKQALSYFSKRRLKKFICFTSILLYDTEANLLSAPVCEDEGLSPYKNEYIFSKFLSEHVVEFYQNSVPSIVIRCSNIYGPTKLVRPDLIPTLIQSCLRDDDVSVWNKAPFRDFIFLEDAADALIALLQTNFTGVINLGTGTGSSVAEICYILEELSGKAINDLEVEVSGPMRFVCDVSLLTGLTGWSPKFNIARGIERTYMQMRKWAPECDFWRSN